MTELLVVGVIALLVIAAAAVFGPRLGLAAPLVLVAVGIVASLTPWVPDVEIDPEWILAGVLPPLLYSSAVSMPAMNFRREFGAISGLSVLLVIGSSLVLGLFFAWVIPGLGLAWGIALGAIVSPTDAVATSIVKQTSVSRRVIAILDGESLLNDATALVLLRTAIAAAAAAFSFWGAVGDFAQAVVVAVAIGAVVGWLNLVVRSRVPDATVNTLLSFAVPFAASVPAEHLGGSGLVAAVVAGLVTGFRAPRVLPPRHRLSDSQNWGTVELVLESAVFLVMGLELATIVGAVRDAGSGLTTAVLIAVGALVLTVLVRTAFVAPLLVALSRSAARGRRMQPRMEGLQQRLSGAGATSSDGEPDGAADPEPVRGPERGRERGRGSGRRQPTARDLQRFSTRIRRFLADIAYFEKAPLGWREGTTVVWAGMRGAVTVAAAQTLPDDGTVPQRSLLVFIAFVVAVLSLAVQGGTIAPLLRRISPPVDTADQDRTERRRILGLLHQAAVDAVGPEGLPTMAATAPQQQAQAPQDADADDTVRNIAPATPGQLERMRSEKERRLTVIAAQRAALLDARDDGTFDAEVLDSVLTNLDADQIALELRGGPAG